MVKNFSYYKTKSFCYRKSYPYTNNAKPFRKQKGKRNNKKNTPHNRDKVGRKGFFYRGKKRGKYNIISNKPHSNKIEMDTSYSNML